MLASACFLAGATLAPSVHADDFVQKMKVKDHKVKVKGVDGKAKIKNKANGKQKFKAKGPNGDIAADIAQSAYYGPAPYHSK